MHIRIINHTIASYDLEVFTKQVAAVIDITFMPHGNLKISLV